MQLGQGSNDDQAASARLAIMLYSMITADPLLPVFCFPVKPHWQSGADLAPDLAHPMSIQTFLSTCNMASWCCLILEMTLAKKGHMAHSQNLCSESLKFECKIWSSS